MTSVRKIGKQNGGVSTQVLIIEAEESDSQDRNGQENPPLMGLNSPSFAEENSSQAMELSSRFPALKTTVENGNYLRENLTVEDGQISPRRPERISYSSTTSPYTPFPGFQVPTETIIPLDNSAQGKRKSGLTAQEAIPVLPRSAAIACLVLNIFIPGLGTAISGLIAFYLTRHDVTLRNRTNVLCVNCFVGIMQLSTVVFLFIGWIWSIAWGCAFVGLSEQYGKRAEKVEGGEAVA